MKIKFLDGCVLPVLVLVITVITVILIAGCTKVLTSEETPSGVAIVTQDQFFTVYRYVIEQDHVACYMLGTGNGSISCVPLEGYR
jgi:hypothetical protein